MEKELFKQLSESLEEAVEIHKGKAKPSREFYFSSLDIKHVRESLDFSQSKFAHLSGVEEVAQAFLPVIAFGFRCCTPRRTTPELTHSRIRLY